MNFWDELETYDRSDFETDSRQLESFRIQDFGQAMDGELANVFTDYENLHLRYLSLASYYCDTKARQYIRPPLRAFDAGSEAANQKLAEVYRNSRMNAKLLEAQQKGHGQNQVYLTFDPTTDPLRVDVKSWIAGDVIIEGDPLLSDIRDADKVTIRVPIKRECDGFTEMVTFGRRVYTPTEAYTEAPGGERVGLFNDAMTNPLGYIPMAAVRLTSPRSGWFQPRLPLDVLSVQIGIILGAADIENIVRLKSPGREVVVGPQATLAVKKRYAGPEGLLGIDDQSGDGTTRYEYVDIDPRIDRYITSLEFTSKLAFQFRCLNPDGLWTSTGITGAAKEVERDAEVQDGYRQELIWQEAERDIVAVVADIAKTGPSALSLGAASVDVDFRYVQARQNDLQEAQTFALLMALGLEDAAELMAQRKRIDIEEARERVPANLDAWADVLRSWRDDAGATQAPPGLDSIAQSILP